MDGICALNVRIRVAFGGLGGEGRPDRHGTRGLSARDAHAVELHGARLHHGHSTRLLLTETAVCAGLNVLAGVGRGIRRKGVGRSTLDPVRAGAARRTPVPRPNNLLVAGHIGAGNLGCSGEPRARLNLRSRIERNRRHIDGARGGDGVRGTRGIRAVAERGRNNALNALALIAGKRERVLGGVRDVGIGAVLGIGDLPLIGQL